MTAARSTCPAHDDYVAEIRATREDVRHVSEDTAVIRAAIESMRSVPERLTVVEERVAVIRQGQRRWAGLIPSVIASVSSSAITGVLVYLVTTRGTP